ncbi:MAG: SMAD/FHA domain-containing protein [Benniella sp.]|nr:MAG: SMAD/FHA domain-containing protein [Benniella sp.]
MAESASASASKDRQEGMGESRRRERSFSRSRSRSRSPYRRRRDNDQRRYSRSRSPGRYRSRSRSRSRSISRSRQSPRRRRSLSRSRSPIRDRGRNSDSYRPYARSRSRSRSGSPRGRDSRDGRGYGRGEGEGRSRDRPNDNRGGRGGHDGSGRGRGRGRGGGPRHESTFRGTGGPGGGKGQPEVWGAKMVAEEEAERKQKPVVAEEDKEKPNFGLSGALAAETNTTANGTLLKYNEPPEARKPKQRWRLYVFKDGKEIDVLHIHRQSAFLFGRDRNVVDIPTDHPSCSKQHAVLQFRQIVETNALGQASRKTKPFVIDLESANGTFVNGAQIPPTRYYELKLSDVLKFGASTREFVLLHEGAEVDES